jgi:hypothetical protein
MGFMEKRCVGCFYKSFLLVSTERGSSWSRDSSVGIVTRLRAGWSGSKPRISIPAVVLSPLPYKGCRGSFQEIKIDRFFKLTTYLHLVPRLRMCGAVSLLPLYVFMASTDTAVQFYCCHPFVTEETLSSVVLLYSSKCFFSFKKYKKTRTALLVLLTDILLCYLPSASRYVTAAVPTVTRPFWNKYSH